MILVFLGAPGSGKGTQAKILSEKKKFFHISTGDLFREEIAKQSELGKKVKDIISQGKLVSDDIVINVIENKIKTLDKNIIFDGFPRTIEQAEALDNMLEKYNKSVDMVLFFEIDEKKIIERISARRSCPKCGKVYNLISQKPKVDNKCDVCNTELIQRDDDKKEVIARRLEVYKEQTSPLISYYRTQNIFNVLNADKTPEEIYSELDNLINKKEHI